ncbi:MAG: hypothetical protein Q4G48_09510 [Bacteroidia bacterium]|nr:hypothetical protein [Bacteroidia bacterium]
MATDNLISIAFTEEELQRIDEAGAVIRSVLEGKTRNLTPEQRRQYGRIAEQNKLFVNKARDFMAQYPEFVPPFLDKEEFEKDYQARLQIESRLLMLEGIAEQLSDTKILLDYDNYYNALTFYRNIRYLSGENVPGTTNIFEGLKQFFSGGRPAKIEEENPE